MMYDVVISAVVAVRWSHVRNIGFQSRSRSEVDAD